MRNNISWLLLLLRGADIGVAVIVSCITNQLFGKIENRQCRKVMLQRQCADSVINSVQLTLLSDMARS